MFRKIITCLTVGLLGAFSIASTATAYRMYNIKSATYTTSSGTSILHINEIQESNVEEGWVQRKGIFLELTNECKGYSYDHFLYAPPDVDKWLWALLIVLETVTWHELDKSNKDVDWFYDPESDLLVLGKVYNPDTAIAAYPEGTSVDSFTDDVRDANLCIATVQEGLPIIFE